MGAYPNSPRSAFMAWCDAHTQVFTDHAATIGLSAAQALAFKNATEKAAGNLSKAESARIAAETAVRDAADAVAALRATAGNTVRIIRAFAETSTDPNGVYSRAQFAPPAPPSPVGPPGQPTDLRVELEAATGILTLRWKCANPAAGTSYIVQRRLPDETNFSFLGVTGSKKFIDTALLAGPDMVQYIVQGQRSGQSGPTSEVFTINFGQSPGGRRIASVSGGGGQQVSQSQRGQQNFASASGGGGAYGATDMSPSTVNGHEVQKTLPGQTPSRRRS